MLLFYLALVLQMLTTNVVGKDSSRKSVDAAALNSQSFFAASIK